MSNSNLDFIESADIYQQQSQSNPDQNNWDGDPEIAEEEEFLIHLKFDHGSYPLRHDVNNIDFLGVKDGNLFIRIGDSYFMGEYDKRNNSSILFGYDKHNQVYSTDKCRSKIFMKRVLLKSKVPKQN